MLAFSRFRVPADAEASFVADADAAVAFLAGRPGCLGAELVRSLDEPDLWALQTTWENVGSYRRAFNGYEAKVILYPLLNRALDEPSAYAAAEVVGQNVPRAGR